MRFCIIFSFGEQAKIDEVHGVTTARAVFTRALRFSP
jgi:hypothetical protein